MGEASEPPVRLENAWFTAWRFTVALALVIFLVFPEVVLNSSSFVYRDFGLFGYPLAFHFRESFWHGEVPLWNPFNNCGLPFLAQWNTMVCYPASLIYLLLPLPWSLNLFCLLHLLLAGVTMYLLAFRWTGSGLAASMAGFAFAFSGSVLSTLIWPNYIATLAWTPAVLLCCERARHEGGRWLVIAALVGTMQMLSGTPELILFTWLMVLALSAGDLWQNRAFRFRALGRLLTVVVLVSGLSAVQLFPFLDLFVHSHRDTNFSTGAYATPFSGLANYIVPLFRTTPGDAHFQPEQFCVSSLYAGIGVLALALWALIRVREGRVRLLGVILFVSIWLALGDKAGLYAWLRETCPGANFMRYPVKCALMGSFLFPLLAAFGLKEWLTSSSSRRKLPQWSTQLGAALALVLVAIVLVAFFRPLHETDWQATWHSALSRSLFLGSAAAALWGLAVSQEEKKRLACGLALLTVVMLDGITHTPSQNPVVPPSVYARELPTLEQMEPKPALGRSRALLNLTALDGFHNKGVSDPAANFLIRRVGLFENCNLIDRVPKVDGFYALYLPWERDVHFRLYDEQGEARTNLADFLGACQVTSQADILEWTPRYDPMPFITAGQQPIFLEPSGTLDALMRDTFNPRATVLLPLSARASLTATNHGSCHVLSSQVSVHEIRASTEAAEPALVVISQAHYHWWKARVDGQPTAIMSANHAFQAIEVPAGKHEIQLVYRDQSFVVGLILTLLTLAGTAGFWWWLRPPRGGEIADSALVSM